MEVGFARAAHELLPDASYFESDAAHHIDPAHVPLAREWLADDAVSSLAADLVNTRPRPSDPGEKLTGPDAVAALLAPTGCRRRRSTRSIELRGELLHAFEARDMDDLATALNPLLARGATLRLLPTAMARAPRG